MAIVGYGRVSTFDQSLEIQLEELTKAGCTKIFQEKQSGSSMNGREQLKLLLDYVREGDTVVVCKLDRIARSTIDLLNIAQQLEQKEVAFKVLNINLDTSTPTGKLMLTMLGAIASFEREMMLERQRAGIAKAKTKGLYTGRKPTAIAKTAEVLRLLELQVPKSQIAERLNISQASVYRIIQAQKEDKPSGEDKPSTPTPTLAEMIDSFDPAKHGGEVSV
jgi:DNA invertase Pin-like site-specific DNA recombinase